MKLEAALFGHIMELNLLQHLVGVPKFCGTSSRQLNVLSGWLSCNGSAKEEEEEKTGESCPKKCQILSSSKCNTKRIHGPA